MFTLTLTVVLTSKQLDLHHITFFLTELQQICDMLSTTVKTKNETKL